MERSRAKAVGCDIGQGPHHTCMSDTEQVEVVRMVAISCKDRNGIEGRTIMVQLPLDTGELAAIDKIPITTCTAIVTPVRHGRHVSNDGIERHLSFFVEAEKARPEVYLFLTCRIPWHLTPEWIIEGFPMLCSLAHGGFKLVGHRC
ncbi:hypothetical protein D3C72_1162320 [compost metagenome]